MTLSEAKVALIADLYQQGVVLQQIAEQVGCCESTVFRYAIQLGLPRRRRRYKFNIPAPPTRPSNARWKDPAPEDYIPRQPELDEPAWNAAEEQAACDHEHATYNSNCPSPHCRAGKAAYWRARQAAVKRGAAEVGQHGTGGYRQGCRCEVCRTAVREKRRAERAAK